MKFQRFTKYMLEHRLEAVLLTFGFTFIPVLGVLGILFAALVTLRKGPAEGAIVTVAATMPYVFSFMLASHDPNALPIVLWTAVMVAVVSNILTWVFASMLAWQLSWSRILQIAALIGVLVISVIHLQFANIADWWSAQLTSYYTQASKAMSEVLNETANGGPSDAQLESIKMTKYYISGMIGSAILLNAVLQLVVARWWQSILYAPGVLRRELHHIRLSKMAGILFMVGIILSYIGNNSVVLDIMPIAYLLFAGAGLSLIHFFFGKMVSPTRWFWISLLYVAIIFAMPLSVVIVAMMALFDVWFDLRKRFGKE